MRSKVKFYKGAVSLFMVVFSMLMITTMTLSFLRLMNADQRQASDSDLSQSAYDSSLAGVEDAKRALLKYQRECATGGSGCRKDILKSDVCNFAVKSLVGVSENAKGEVPIQRASGSANDRKSDQAYTCVKIIPDTPDYEGTMNLGEQAIIPLRPAGSTFDSVKISWFSRERDLKSASGAVNRASVASMPLLAQGRWPDNRPPILRTQLMQFSGGFRLDQFDKVTTSGQSNTNTIFLYPTTSNVKTVDIAANDGRRVEGRDYPSQSLSANTPYPASCRDNIASGGFACEMTITLPRAVGASSNNRTAYLRLMPFYKGTEFKVEMFNGAPVNPVLFDNVQPEVDSTGRANSLFRRVKARVNLENTNFPFPEATVDVHDNFCKDFTVTPERYIAGSCSY